MVLDVAGPNFDQGLSRQFQSNIEHESSHTYEISMEEDINPSIEEASDLPMEEEPNPESQRFYDLLYVVDAKLYPGSSVS
ncbi:hypothetical protein KY290_034091 [Solanum tuberosum]|uniref:Uncharacterized protein n=1 Tax=Solanum tuberosum TaxID=4113 RepID=A0ABQ7U431_SOLTU|nr:hypothetical protein KY289_033484 [Solanum tuberosum]KAH0741048.1 hypothetical protein KY290_034091 [Solanum tuberosum]